MSPQLGDVLEEVVTDKWPLPALDAARAVLPNNILVLSGDTGNSSISDFVEEGSCQPPDPARLPCYPSPGTGTQLWPRTPGSSAAVPWHTDIGLLG